MPGPKQSTVERSSKRHTVVEIFFFKITFKKRLFFCFFLWDINIHRLRGRPKLHRLKVGGEGREVGLAISDKKIIPWKTEQTEQLLCSGWNSGYSGEQQTIGIPFRTISWKRKMLGIPYSGTKLEANFRNSGRTKPRKRKILGLPRNEHLLPRNNGKSSKSIPWTFFGTKFRCQP